MIKSLVLYMIAGNHLICDGFCLATADEGFCGIVFQYLLQVWNTQVIVLLYMRNSLKTTESAGRFGTLK